LTAVVEFPFGSEREWTGRDYQALLEPAAQLV
jgi:hypothetical protein